MQSFKLKFPLVLERVSFYCCCDKVSVKNKEGFILSHGLRVQFIIVAKVWWQKYGVVGHTALAVRDEC